MSAPQGNPSGQDLPLINIKPLLSKLWPIHAEVSSDEIADAISHFFTNQVSEAQTASLLMALHFTQLDFKAEVLAKCAASMRKAAETIDSQSLRAVIEKRGRKEGLYNGGLVRDFFSSSCPSLGTHIYIYSRQGETHIIRKSMADISLLASVTLLALEETPTTRSTSAPRPPSSPHHCSSSPSTGTRPARQSQAAPTWSTRCSPAPRS